MMLRFDLLTLKGFCLRATRNENQAIHNMYQISTLHCGTFLLHTLGTLWNELISIYITCILSSESVSS